MTNWITRDVGGMPLWGLMLFLALTAAFIAFVLMNAPGEPPAYTGPTPTVDVGVTLPACVTPEPTG